MIKVDHLFFGYTKELFIKDISFEVNKGEILGFLGPSGAGKSTLQKILIGMLKNYTGSVVVNGTEVCHHDNGFYEHIGVDFEFPTLYEKLTARENLAFFSSLYSQNKKDVDVLLDGVGLLPDADKKVSAFSKGMKSRLNFVKSLVHDPEILFLDEPTSGLDPTNSHIMKKLILEEKTKGKTIILTTHNMQDAVELCDKVAFIVDGKLKAMDTPHNLIMKKSAASIVYTYKENGIEKSGTCEVASSGSDLLLNQLIRENRLQTIHSKEQTLGDVFMDITGRQLT